MREITTHQINECNAAIGLAAVGEPGAGGASIEYVVTVPKQSVPLSLKFQSQAAVLGANGITHEVLLAVLIDRLQGFQGGPYACRENAIALTKLEEALLWLNKRTLQRVARGVEGTHQV